MADYEFYVNEYLGTELTREEFPGLAAQTRWELERMKRLCRVEGGEEAENLAICAMAEELGAYRRLNLSSASAGSVSVHYADTARKTTPLRRRLLERAGTYLDIYRGVGA